MTVSNLNGEFRHSIICCFKTPLRSSEDLAHAHAIYSEKIVRAQRIWSLRRLLFLCDTSGVQVGAMTKFLMAKHKVSALLEQARAVGFSQTALDAAMDEDDSKAAIAALIAGGEVPAESSTTEAPAKKKAKTSAEAAPAATTNPAEESDTSDDDDDDSEEESDESEEEEWTIERDDTAVWKFCKAHHEDWVEWLRDSRLAGVGHDPSRHDAVTLRRFWNSEHPLPAPAFREADRELTRQIASIPIMRDAFVEFLKSAPLKLTNHDRCDPHRGCSLPTQRIPLHKII